MGSATEFEKPDLSSRAGTPWRKLLDDYGLPTPVVEWQEPSTHTRIDFASELALDVEDYLQPSSALQIELDSAAADTFVTDFNLLVNGVDSYAFRLAGNYGGFRWNGETLVRGSGEFPTIKFNDFGFQGEISRFILPERLEFIGRTSQTFGAAAGAAEYSGRVNWILNAAHNLKLTFDVSQFIAAPGETSGENDTSDNWNVTFKTQFEVAF